MISILKRMFLFNRVSNAPLTIQVGTDIASCPHCMRYLNNSYALSFITHAVEHHKLDHDTAVQVLDMVHNARWKGFETSTK